MTIYIPQGFLNTGDDAAAAERRRQLRETLMKGGVASVNQSGQLTPGNNSHSSQPAIQVPPGKLAGSFYWYERDRQLLEGEIAAMQRFFPQFYLDKLPDGRLSWVGSLNMENLRQGSQWILQAIYDHSHPHNNSYGGSISIYSIEPDLHLLKQKLGTIPHLLKDSQGNYLLCTSQKDDFRASVQHSTTAASALSWAAKWIAVFELWIAGDVTTAQFQGHTF